MENNSRSGLLKEEIDLLVLRYGISREFLQNYLHDSSFKKNTGIENIENIPLLEVKNVNNQKDTKHPENGKSEIGKKFEHEEQILDKTNEILQNSFESINNLSIKVLQNINELIITKKTYKIRQNFRNLMLELLNTTEFVFYLIHESGRIEFQDFSSNFITEILETDPKCSSLQNIISSTSQEFHFIDIADNSELAKVFEVNPMKINRNSYFGLCFSSNLSQDDQNFQICLMIKKHRNTEKQKLYEDIDCKLISKIIQISMISTSQQSNQTICKIYSKKMLDLLQILIINSQKKWQNQLCDYHSFQQQDFLGISLKSILKLVLKKKISPETKQKKHNLITIMNRLVNKIEEDQFQKIQEIRMYKKYVRDGGVIFLQFNSHGALCFISGNKDHSILNILSNTWQPNKSVLQQTFSNNSKLLQKFQKALKFSVKSDRHFSVAEGVTAKIIQDHQQITKVHITIDDNDDSSHSNSLFESKGTLLKPRQKVKENKAPSITIKMIEKENPGIVEDGWIDLFLKNSIPKKRKPPSRAQTFTKSTKNISIQQLTRRSSFKIEKTLTSIGMEGFQVDNVDLDILTFQSSELQSIVLQIFKKIKQFMPIVGCKSKFKLFQNFLSDIHDHYEVHSNPFHNFTHGVNVMHTCYMIASIPQNQRYLTGKDFFAIVFSGLCHDVGHTGFTNSFEIASQSRKALVYNDQSPLQNYHASTTFEILKKEKNNFLSDLDKKQMDQFRKLVISNILFTDIKEHFPLLKKFNSIKDQFFDHQNANQTLSNIIVHSSDFGGSIRNFKICQEWSHRVNQQFTKQYKVEEELGLPQTPFMKDLQNRSILSKNEAGFLKVIVYPLFEALNSFYSNDNTITTFKKNIQTNIKNWEQIQKTEKNQIKKITLQI